MTKVLLKKPFIVRLLFSLIFCSVTLFLQYKFRSYLPGRYIVLYPVLFFISWIAGFYPAIASIVFCSILSNIIFNPNVPFFDGFELMKTGILAFFAFSIALIIEQARRQERRLRHKLESSSRELSSIIEGMQDAFFALDRDWKIVMVNRNYEMLTLLSREDSIDHFVWEIFPEAADKNSIFWLEANKVMSSRSPSEFESYYSPMDAWVEVRIYPKDNGIALFFRNITKRKMAENELAFSEKSFRFLADSIPHIVWTSTGSGHLDFYNARFYEYTGTQTGDYFNPTWESIIHPDDYLRDHECWCTSLETSVPYHIEYRLKGKDGTYRWFLGLALPVKDSIGKTVKWFGSCTDIDDQKRLARNIEKQNSALEDALKARDEFLSIASHELKTPLTSLKLHSQNFRKGVLRGDENAYTPARIDNLSLQVEKQVSKLNRLVDDMLDISRIRTGNLTLKPQQFQFSDLLGEVHEILKDQFISSNCPSPIIENNCGNILVNWDRIRIEQVLINLLTNAIRYGKGKQIILTTTHMETKILISLKDHGIGIAEENLDKIFNRFEKIPNPSEVSGLGLGLFISKQIIDAHAGKLSVESKLGVGSTFKIELPL
ncbi:MAG: ATP-binding protein [Bacteriovorax sp.]|jgi:PAS domain S-box-containing protein